MTSNVTYSVGPFSIFCFLSSVSKHMQAFRIALTDMLHDEIGAANLAPDTVPSSSLGTETSLACRYLRDRISVPRDMRIWAGKRLRYSLEKTAAALSEAGGEGSRRYPIPFEHRRDQSPAPFVEEASASACARV